MTESDWSRIDTAALGEAIAAFAGVDTPVHIDLVAKLAAVFADARETGTVEHHHGDVDDETAELLDFLVLLDDSSLGGGPGRGLRRTSPEVLYQIMAAATEGTETLTAVTRVATEEVSDNGLTGQATVHVVQAGQLGVVNFDRFQLSVPAQLPRPIRALVGRRHVLTSLDRTLDAVADGPEIAVLVGARGSGKSTAAIYWLQQHRHRFPDGQLRAVLGAQADRAAAPTEVLADFLVSLGIDRAEIPATLESRANLFRSLTRGRSFQILLDDAVTAAQIKCLLPGPGPSTVIVTGEGGFAGLADYGATFVAVEPIEDDIAVELLRGYVGGRVDAEPDALDDVVKLCGGRVMALCVVGRILLDTPDMSIRELWEELQSIGVTRLTVDGEPAISAALDAGYRRLTDLARRCYRLLGLHPGTGGVSLGALAAVLNVSELALRPVARELVHGKRLVELIDGRLCPNTLTREHARSLAAELDGEEECDASRRAFIHWYTKGALAADSVLQPCRPWIRRLFPDEIIDTSHPAHRYAREWMIGERVSLRSVAELAADLGELGAVLRLCVAQWWFFESQAYVDDLIATHDLGIVGAEHLDHLTAKALLLTQKAHAKRRCARFAEATALFAEAAQLAHAQANLELEATAIEGGGLAWFDQGALSEAKQLLNLNLQLAQKIGDVRRMGLACLHAAKPSEPEQAIPLLAEAWSSFHQLGQTDRHSLAKILYWQGRKLNELGDHADAREHLERSLAMMVELGRDADRAQVLDALGDVLAVGNSPDSVQHHLQAARIYEDTGMLLSAAELWRKVGGRES